MGKRKDNPNQFGFAFDAPQQASTPGALAGLEWQVSEAVSAILHRDERTRPVIAAEMSTLLGEEVSREMLDAYSSPRREGHKVPLSRFLALVAVCDRHDMLDQLVRPIGAAVLIGEEVHTAQLGHLDRQIELLRIERKRVASQAPMIRGNRDS